MKNQWLECNCLMPDGSSSMQLINKYVINNVTPSTNYPAYTDVHMITNYGAYWTVEMSYDEMKHLLLEG